MACRCGKSEEECGVCLDCGSPHANCLPCKGGRRQPAAPPARATMPASEVCTCKHIAGVHSLTGACLVAKTAKGGRMLMLPGQNAPGVKHCPCSSFHAVRPASPPPEPEQQQEVEEEDVFEEEFEDGDDEELAV